ncbi:hypothetical protein TNCV_482111 [Trichonephila clavipes]|uniref:Uncharacterized protein n=1 Tax=Trichonephila clavipes TaxID=2585209 RepID=A0A8X6S5C6_TRICX|nr:hypothetical protein TNCV_482111 [Trichonephila clavipes]
MGAGVGTQGQKGLKGPDKLNLTRCSGYKFRSASAKGARRCSAPRARNELKPGLRPWASRSLKMSLTSDVNCEVLTKHSPGFYYPENK